MALLQEIKVPLLAVNDTTLTVVEIAFSSGEKVKKGDLLMVFETSKTTYDVEAEADGYIQYFCETGNDYEVNELVAKIFDELSALELVKPAATIMPAATNTGMQQPVTATLANWEGDTIFSDAAASLVASSGTALSLFKGKDFVSRADVEELLGIKEKQPAKVADPAPVQTKTKPAAAIDTKKLIIEKLSSGKKREIEYLSDIQSTGLTSTINTIVETDGIFIHVNES
ncbi:MAG TPA: biotin/lipoyl-containing protein, partial [Chitinophagaceae bacterium]|nr:biotin/lipoyl-containing protein [Chitinophagaceae bacterium]